MPPPNYAGLTADQIFYKIWAGDESTFTTANTAFASVHTALQGVGDDVAKATGDLVNDWKGPAATRFKEAITRLVDKYIKPTVTSLEPYPGAMTKGGEALGTAKTDIQTLIQWYWAPERTQTWREENLAAFNADGQKILRNWRRLTGTSSKS